MITLTREVRLALSPSAPDPGAHTSTVLPLPTKTHNSWSSHPPINHLEQYFIVRVSVRGELQPQSSYLLNIKTIDDAVRSVVPDLGRILRSPGTSAADLLAALAAALPPRLKPATITEIELLLSPQLSYSRKTDMLYLNQHFEFSAAHRLHNPTLSDADNRKTFGKCNNPAGHGHNYQVKVSITGTPGPDGTLLPVASLDEIVNRHVIDHLDHKHLNEQVPEFDQSAGGVNPSVENIAMVVYRRLAPHVAPARLAAVTVWETPKTWAEYSE